MNKMALILTGAMVIQPGWAFADAQEYGGPPSSIAGREYSKSGQETNQGYISNANAITNANGIQSAPIPPIHRKISEDPVPNVNGTEKIGIDPLPQGETQPHPYELPVPIPPIRKAPPPNVGSNHVPPGPIPPIEIHLSGGLPVPPNGRNHGESDGPAPVPPIPYGALGGPAHSHEVAGKPGAAAGVTSTVPNEIMRPPIIIEPVTATPPPTDIRSLNHDFMRDFNHISAYARYYGLTDQAVQGLYDAFRKDMFGYLRGTLSYQDVLQKLSNQVAAAAKNPSAKSLLYDDNSGFGNLGLPPPTNQ